MIHRLFTVAVAISLLLCVATAALWVRSYAALDWITYCRDLGGHRQRDFNVSADSSWFIVGCGRTLRQRRGGTKLGWTWSRLEPEPVIEDTMDAGFGSLPAQVRLPSLRVRWTRRVVGPGDTIWSFVIVVRLWILFLLAGTANHG